MRADHESESELKSKYELMPACNSCEFKTFMILTTLNFTPAIAAAVHNPATAAVCIATGSSVHPVGFGAMALSFATILPAIGGVLLLVSARLNLRWLVATFALWSTLAVAVMAYTLGIAALAASSDTIQSFFVTASPQAICLCFCRRFSDRG